MPEWVETAIAAILASGLVGGATRLFLGRELKRYDGLHDAHQEHERALTTLRYQKADRTEVLAGFEKLERRFEGERDTTQRIFDKLEELGREIHKVDNSVASMKGELLARSQNSG